MIPDTLTTLIQLNEVEVKDFDSFYALSPKDSSKGYYHYFLEKPLHFFFMFGWTYYLQDADTKQYIPMSRQERKRLVRAVKHYLKVPQTSKYAEGLQRALDAKIKEITSL